MNATALAGNPVASITPVRACPVCHADGGRVLHRQRYALFDDSTLPRETGIVACPDCGTVRAVSRATADDYRRHYARHSKYDTAVAASGSGESAGDAQRLDALAARLATTFDPASSILDIGAGRGGLLAALRRHGFDRLTGIDPSVGCVDAMRAAGFAAEPGTIEDARWAVDPRRFDLVVLSHVLEHVFDVADAFVRVARRVVDDGSIYVEVPDASRYTVDGFPPFYFFDAEHINHFDVQALTRLASRAGWSVRSAWPRRLDLGHGQFYPAIGVLMRRGDAGTASTGRSSVDAIDTYVERSIAASNAGVDRSSLASLADRRTSVVVWGAGSHAQRLLAQTDLGRCAIDCLIDADPGKLGRRLAGHLVVSPEAGLARAVASNMTVVVAIAVGGEAVLHRLAQTSLAARVLRL